MTFKVLLHHYGTFTTPPGRKFVGGIVATVDPVELDSFSIDQMKPILTNCLGYDENSPMFLYMKKPNCSFDSGLVPLADAIQDSEMILIEFKLDPLTYQDDSVLNINVPALDFEDIVSYLKRKITRRFTTLYYTLPPNNKLLGMKAIKNDYDTNVMYNIGKVAGKLQIYVSLHPIDLSTLLIPNDGSLEESFSARIPMYVNGGIMNITIPRMKLEEMKQYLFNIIVQGKLEIYIDHVGVNFIIAKYIYPNASLAEIMNHVITDYTSDNEDERREVT
ncbi:hypothetical protein Tco_1218905 [Tanacetum coccineum]